MRFVHLNLVVADPMRSAAFYARHLMPQGETVWLGDSLHLRDRTGSDMAFQKGDPARPRPGAHHGFLARSAEEVDRLRDRLLADRIEITDDCAEDGFRSVKFRDPDGYECEVYWEEAWPKG